MLILAEIACCNSFTQNLEWVPLSIACFGRICQHWSWSSLTLVVNISWTTYASSGSGINENSWNLTLNVGFRIQASLPKNWCRSLACKNGKALLGTGAPDSSMLSTPRIWWTRPSLRVAVNVSLGGRKNQMAWCSQCRPTQDMLKC